MARTSTLLGLGAWLAFALLGGCNSVLGIEEAVPRGIAGASTGSGGSGTTGGRSTTSTPDEPISMAFEGCNNPLPDCETCLSKNCGSKLTACLTTRNCREALDDYRACLGTDCADNNDRDCNEALYEADSTIGGCVSDNCDDACRGSSLAATCQLYCSCMTANCPGQLPSSCMTSCLSVKLDDIGCRLVHCQVANLSPASHCLHAIGEANECPRSFVKDTCPGKHVSGWTCEKDSECCSLDCDEATQICN